MPKKPAASTIKQRAIRTEALERAMVAGPKPPKPDAAVLAVAKKPNTHSEGKVIYLGHIPHGFYEEQMRGFFSQFGEVTRVRVSRNKKTGHSKHFGWVEFKHPSVAKIAAETMDNYLLCGSVLKVKVVPPSELHPSTLKGANKRFVPRASSRVARVKHNAPRSDEDAAKVAARLVKAEGKRRARIAAAGIDYDFEGYAGAAQPAAAAKAATPPAPPKAAAKTAAKRKAAVVEEPAAPEPVPEKPVASKRKPAAAAAPEPEPVAEKPVAAKRKAAAAPAPVVKEPVAKPAAKKAAAKAAPAAPAPELDAPEPARRASSRAKAPAAAPAPAVAAPAAAAPAKRARKA